MKVASRNAQRPGHDDVNIRGSVRQLVDETRSFGGVAALRSLGYRALNKILPIRILLGMTAVLDDVDRTLFDTSGFAVRLAADDELRAAAGEPEWAAEMPRSFVDQALARGDGCVGIFDGQRRGGRRAPSWAGRLAGARGGGVFWAARGWVSWGGPAPPRPPPTPSGLPSK